MPADQDYRPKNKFKVPVKVWSSWTLIAKHVFNKTYEYSMKNQEMMKNPKVEVVPDSFWDTTAWNHAWMAASVCSRGEKQLLKDITQKAKG